MSDTASDVLIALAVVVVTLIVLDVLRRRGMDPIGAVGRAITPPMGPESVVAPPSSPESSSPV